MSDEYPSNSRFAATQPEKSTTPKKTPVEKVVTGEVIKQKKPLSRKFKELFVGGEAKSVWTYIALDVMVPAAKDMVSDAVSQGIDRLLFGDRGPRYTSPRRRGSYGQTYVSYNSRSYAGPNRAVNQREYDRRGPERPSMSRRARAAHDFDEILLVSRPEAERVLERMSDLIDLYERATVSDLYDLVGLTSNFTDESWGWYEINGADIIKVRNGYLLDLPAPVQLPR